MQAVLWDVVEEHLDEAEFLVEVWHGDLDSPAYLRREFEAGPQERLLAHIDGLVVGGDVVRSELLEGVLADEDTERWRAAAVALALLATPSSVVSAPLFEELHARPEEVRTGIVAALSMSERPDIDARVVDALRRATDPVERVALATVGGARGVNPGNLVDEMLEHGDAAARTAAMSMLAFGDRRYVGWAEHCVSDSDPHVRWSAARAGLVMGSARVWQAIGGWGLAAEPDASALVVLATLADARIIERMCERLDEDASRAAILGALGYSGRVVAMEACLRWVSDEAVGPIAGEAFAVMTGLPLDDDAYWDDVAAPEESEEDLEADVAEVEDASLESQPEDELRVPKPAAFARWWREHGPRFDPKVRYIAGVPADQASIARAVRSLPLRNHHPFAFELLVRSKAALFLRTRALTFASQGVLESLSSVARIDGQRAFGR